MTARIVNCAVDEDRVNSGTAWLFNYIALEGRGKGSLGYHSKSPTECTT